MRSSGIKNGEYVAGCRPIISKNQLIYSHLRRTSGRKLDCTPPFLAADTQKMLAQQATTPNNG